MRDTYELFVNGYVIAKGTLEDVRLAGEAHQEDKYLDDESGATSPQEHQEREWGNA